MMLNFVNDKDILFNIFLTAGLYEWIFPSLIGCLDLPILSLGCEWAFEEEQFEWFSNISIIEDLTL